MNEQATNNQEKGSRRKWPWILLLGILATVALARIALMTGPVHRWVKQTIINTAGQQFSPELAIGNISGDLWKRATLSNITLTEGETTVAKIDTLYLEYNALSYFGEALEIQEVRLVNPSIQLRQRQDSSWNIQHWVADTDTAVADTTDGAFSFLVSDLLIKEGSLEVDMLQLPKDSAIVMDELNLSSRIASYGGSYEANLQELTFKVKNTRLDTPVTVATAAEADSSSVTLEKLALSTGHSMLNASGRAHLVDSTAQFQAEAVPVGWQDLVAYAKDLPVREDINMSVNLRGAASDFEVGIMASAQGIQDLDLESHFAYDSTLTLTSFEASAQQLDLESFTGDTAMPRLEAFHLQTQGELPLGEYQRAQMQGTLSMRNVQQANYQLDQLNGSLTLQNNEANIKLTPRNGSEELTLSAAITRFWDEKPSVQIHARGRNINLQNWLPGEEYRGQVSFQASIDGSGWFPEEELWRYQLTLEESRIMDQRIDRGSFSGHFNQQVLTNQSQLTVARSKIGLQAELRRLQNMPEFTYSLTADSVNFADFSGLERYKSSITANMKGSGRGISLEDLVMNTSVTVDSSIFRGEVIRNMRMDMQIADSVITVDHGMLESDILAGTYNGRIYARDLYNPDNIINLDVQLKDLSSLAPLADVEVLQATGTVRGRVTPSGQDSVVFESTVDLQDINYDDQFTAPNISGDMRLGLSNAPEYAIDIDVESPTVTSMELKNISLQTNGELSEKVAAGSFELELAGRDKDHIRQAGHYRIGADSTKLSLSEFDLTTELRTLSLQRPFHAVFEDGSIQTDTLHLSTTDNAAFMELAIPYTDSLHQKGYFKARKLNLRAIQDGIFNKSYITGILSGELALNRTDTSIAATSDVLMSDLTYEGTELDTLRLEGTLEDESLKGTMALHQDGDLIAEGNLDVPFKARNPEQLQEDFFERPVNGQLTLHAVNLSRFNNLLEQFGYENIKGILSFDGRLEGKAGDPQLNAALRLKEAEFSGVPIDSLTASVAYTHSDSTLDLNSTLTSLKQKALEMNAHMPLAVDLRGWEVGLPGPKDSISVAVQTDEFNLQALNDFIDRRVVRNLKGKINGKVDIQGPRDDLEASGEVTLSDGAVRVVDAGIRLDNMRSTIQFKPDHIELVNFRMKSGNGNLNAQGALALEKLVPGNIDLEIRAENFKAANTNEYNGIVNLDLQVDGEVSKPNLSGSIDVVNGFVKLDNFGEKSVEEVSLDTTLSAEPNISLYDSLSLDMDINFNRRFWVRNQRYLEMELELDGQIDVLKDAGKDLQIFGTLNTANGYAEPLGKRFELEEGSLAFSGPPDNPQVNVRTLYEPPQAEQEIKIWYIIEGTVEKPEFKYESTPPMDLAGIISYTLFGQPFYKLNPAEQSVASTSSDNTAADFAVEVLLDRVEALATRRLGIDVVRIEQTRIGGDSGTSVTTGWYINPKVFFAIQNVITGSTPSTGFFLEYYLKQNLKLILSQDNDNRQGVDVQWEHDY